MNTRKVDKREQHVRKKLTAAILMLLISCIMTVTSTYAWFTLSTAPEVTGIQTTIGGNGNLEIALANASTWADPSTVKTLTSTSDDITVTNASWGNLIDVSPKDTDTYGINKLTLSPAKLNLDGNTVESSTILSVPKYGADGRISQLTAAMNATYNTTDSSFTMVTPTNYGVRAIGISAAMTSRQSNYMNAKSAVSSSVNLTKQQASTGLKANGGTLGNIAVKLATGNSVTITFTQDEIDTVMALLTDTQTAAKNLDDAILSMMDAYIASADNQEKKTGDTTTGFNDTEYGIIKNTLASMDIFDATTNSLSSNITINTTETDGTVSGSVSFKYTVDNSEKTYTVTETGFVTILHKYKNIRTNLNTAISSLQTQITTEAESGDKVYSWSQIEGSVNAMMNINAVKVAGMTMEELKQKKDNGSLVNALMPYVSNLVVELGPGSGVYYDMAELAGTIKAGMTMNVDYAGMNLNDLNATILAECNIPLISKAVNTFKYPTSDGSAEASRISDIYGYALDLLFRTNADNSSLLLQTTPVDRIYSDNNNEDTLGGGSTMTFTKSTASYSTESMLGLMDAIKIVFIDDNGAVLGKAGLDTGSKTTYKTVSDGTATHVLADGNYYEVKYVADTNATGGYRVATGEEEAKFYLKDNAYVEASPTHKQIVTTNYVQNADGTFDVNVRMYNEDGKTFIYEDTKAEITTYTYTEASTDATHVKVGETYYEVKYVEDSADSDKYVEAGADDSPTHYYDGTSYVAANPTHKATPTVTYETINPVITALTQNTPKKISVIVYLDGDKVGNDDVANAATSLTATLNLQFASDAGLIPMEYSGLHVQSATPTPTPEGH